MMRNLLFVVLCLTLLGMTCLGEPALPCSNPLDGSKFGFTLAVPNEFQCQATPPSSLLPDFMLALISFVDRSTNQTITVIVSQRDAQTDAAELPASVETLDPHTTANNIEFALGRATPDDASVSNVSYAAATVLPGGGSLLLIVIEAPTDVESLQETLTAVIETVQLTG